MKTSVFFLRSLLTLVLLGSNVPAWSGVYTCSGSGHSLGCIKACATANALFTQDGKLPIVGKGSCHVKLQSAPAGTLAGPVAAPFAPAQGILSLACAVGAAADPASVSGLETRGPPPGTAYLSSQHPFANGPPTLL